MTEQPRFVPVRELFNGHRRFRVPIYQRGYAWGQVEIETLIRDIVSVLDKPKYYIGSLVLHEVRDVESDQPMFDVIDGQQRLTTLFLALTHPQLRQRLAVLDTPFEVRDRLLFFEERARSNLDLATLSRTEVSTAAMSSLHDEGISTGAEALANILADSGRLHTMVPQHLRRDSAEDDLVNEVLTYLLDNVEIVMTELPPETDLNHYFEIMNTRGEQLEKHEIVKAHLLDRIGEDAEGRTLFATVWDACSDFTRHIQSRFEPSVRSRIFGDPKDLHSEGWSDFVPRGSAELHDLVAPARSVQNTEAIDLDALLGDAPSTAIEPTGLASSTGAVDDGDTGHYGAVIDFPNFLLHVLRLEKGGDQKVSLDDKKLVSEFDQHVTTRSEALSFAFRLLRTKFLFDNFVIKPLDEPGNSNESNWVIHRLHYTKPERRENGKLSPASPFTGDRNQVRMLQAMFQVTHARRVYKEFLYDILEYLDETWSDASRVDAAPFVFRLHQMAEADLADLKVDATRSLDGGTDVPHFALNLLDYKLWWLSEIEGRASEDLPKVKASGFNFAYRTSIEHFLPVNLAEGEEQNAVVNNFGNLCLMTRSENSRRSDHTPDWKVQKYGDSDQSLKFYYMAARQRSDGKWDTPQIADQTIAMREILFTPLPTASSAHRVSDADS